MASESQRRSEIYLEAHKQIRAVFLGESVLSKRLSRFLDGGELFGSPEVRIEVPELPSDVVVGRSEPRTTSLGDLQFPHFGEIGCEEEMYRISSWESCDTL